MYFKLAVVFRGKLQCENRTEHTFAEGIGNSRQCVYHIITKLNTVKVLRSVSLSDRND